MTTLIHAGLNHSCLRLALTGLLALGLFGCGSSGPDNKVLPEQSSARETTPASYTGPAPQTTDIQQYKINFWDNLVANNRCGSCHAAAGQSPQFVHPDDVNLAYAQTTPYVDRDNPANSAIVLKVAGGHNCWEEVDSVCADIIEGYVASWVGSGGSTGNEIQLIAPTAVSDPGASKNLPESSDLFASHVYPLLDEHCSQCHTDTAAIPISPYFASADVDAAYAAALSKIDLDNPANSRLVVRLGSEFHNCWSSCGDDALDMQAAIEAMAENIELTEVDPKVLFSKAMTLTDGILANAGGRFEDDVIALYEFKSGTGTTAFDTSGVEPSLNLTLSGSVEWVGGWGIKINDGKAQGSTSTSGKLQSLIQATGEYTVEAWVAPGNVTQEEARIVSYSGGPDAANFSLQQSLYNYLHFNRSTTTDAIGEPAIMTNDNDEVAQASLQHVVVTYDPVNGRRLFVNGEDLEILDGQPGGLLNDWDDTFALVIGNETSGDRLWQGTVRLVAIHNRSLSIEQIQQNFSIGVGEKFFLLFDVSEPVDMPSSYVVFEVSQFDSYSYLFNEPFFANLSSQTPSGVPLKGLRLGINGREAGVGQAFANLDLSLNSTDYIDGKQTLSPFGTIIALEKGPESDEFFLTFEQLGSETGVVVVAEPPTPSDPVDLEPQADIGLRTFDEIDASLAALTGISRYQNNVRETYLTVKQQLPTVPSPEGFLSAHQMAVTQLAIAYCDALVDNSSLSSALWPQFNFGAQVDSAYSDSGRSALIEPMLERMLVGTVETQPETTATSDELNNLIDRLAICANDCSSNRTQTIAKAVCAAAFGSAGMLIQ